jgi:hypothetical protein
LNIPPVTFIFHLPTLFFNAWSSKLIWSITTSLCVPCISTWKQLVSSLWMNVAKFMFQLLHICNLLTISILTPLHSPCMLSTNYAHLFVDYENTSGYYTDFFINYAHNFNDYANTFND